ncbi:MAG: NTP transferase domain-containing protein [Ignavibacteriaceae bacterium]|nr:NTP transferase domain-containing protein [Ignavibacteriaceae bacterium]
MYQSNKSILNPKKIYGVILSAGLSGRMKKFKPLAEYKGKTFIYNIILKLSSVCDKIIVVTGFKGEDLKNRIIGDLSVDDQAEMIKKLLFVQNENYKKGMFTSLQTGLAGAKECHWILYHFVDQPGLPEKFYPDFINEIDDNYNWIQPVNKEQKGHPILIQKELFGLILEATDNSNLREISNNPKVKKKFWECGYEEIFQDIDTEEDYQMLD